LPRPCASAQTAAPSWARSASSVWPSRHQAIARKTRSVPVPPWFSVPAFASGARAARKFPARYSASLRVVQYEAFVGTASVV
jgi:hypothetical protein